jgi:hypothetical protein
MEMMGKKNQGEGKKSQTPTHRRPATFGEDPTPPNDV